MTAALSPSPILSCLQADLQRIHAGDASTSMAAVTPLTAARRRIPVAAAAGVRKQAKSKVGVSGGRGGSAGKEQGDCLRCKGWRVEGHARRHGADDWGKVGRAHSWEMRMLLHHHPSCSYLP